MAKKIIPIYGNGATVEEADTEIAKHVTAAGIYSPAQSTSYQIVLLKASKEAQNALKEHLGVDNARQYIQKHKKLIIGEGETYDAALEKANVFSEQYGKPLNGLNTNVQCVAKYALNGDEQKKATLSQRPTSAAPETKLENILNNDGMV